MKLKSSIVITILVIMALVWYVLSNIDDFEILTDISIIKFLFLVLLHGFTIFIGGIFIRILANYYGSPVGLKDSFYSTTISSMGNFLFPTGTGSAAQAKFLKDNYYLNYKSYISALTGSYILIFLITSILGIASTILLKSVAENYTFWLLITLFGCIGLITFYLAVYGIPKYFITQHSKIKLKPVQNIYRILVDIVSGWREVSGNRKLLFLLLGVTFINFIVSMLIAYFSIDALGLSIAFVPLVLYTVLGSMTILINITPGSLGVREALYIFTASLISFTAVEVISVGIIDRLARFTALCILLFVFILPRAVRRLKQN